MDYIIDNNIFDSEYLDDFLCALSKVDKKYKIYSCNDLDGNEKTKYPERVFAYEFYHQYRLIMEEKREKYDGLYLNGEQPKSSEVWKGLARITPDLVLHSKIGEKDETGESQKWLCEIKMVSNPKIVEDLKKIKEDEHILKFADYIFLYVGATLQNLKDKLEGCNKDKLNFDTICICAFYDDDGLKITCRRLNEIINI